MEKKKDDPDTKGRKNPGLQNAFDWNESALKEAKKKGMKGERQTSDREGGTWG